MIGTDTILQNNADAAVKLRVSVVIPSYRSKHLESVVEAVTQLDPFEIIIVDTSPQKPEINGVTLHHQEQRLNAGAARNMGAAKARGDVLLFVDSDVILNPNVASVIQKMTASKTPDILCGLYEPDPKESAASRFQNGILEYRLHSAAKDDQALWSSSHFLIRRQAFRHAGGFDETLDYYEDMEFFMRCKLMGLQIKVDPSFVAKHLKAYDAVSLLGDYARKTHAAIKTRWRLPRLFKGHDGGIPMSLHISGGLGCLGALTLLAGSAIAASGVDQLPGAGAVGVGVLLVIASLLSFPRAALRESRAYSADLWALCYGVIWLSLARAFSSALINSVGITCLSFIDFARNGMRVLFRTGRPVQIINYITSRCNLRCSHCFYKETLDNPDPGEIPRDRLLQVMRDLGPVLWYSLAGGEPFIRRDLETLILDVQRICRPKVFSFPTNGWYTERTFETVLRTLQRLPRGNLILFFSLDGPKDIHDEIRGPGSFDKLSNTIERLRPLKSMYPNLYLNLVTTVTPTNAEVAPQFVRDCIQNFKPDSLSINLYREHSLDAPRLPGSLIEAYDQTVNAYAQEVSKGKVGGYGFFGSKILRAKEFLQKDLILRVARNNEYVTPCTAGTLSYVIMEDGRVKPCEILDDSIGNVYDDTTSLAGMIKSPEAKKLRKWIKDTECRCTYECAMSTNSLFSWPMVPKLILKTLFG